MSRRFKLVKGYGNMPSYKLTLLTALASLVLLSSCGRGSASISPTPTPPLRYEYPTIQVEMGISESAYNIYFYPPLPVDRECVEQRMESYRQSRDIVIRHLFLDGDLPRGLVFVGISPRESGEKYKGEILDEIETCRKVPINPSDVTNQST